MPVIIDRSTGATSTGKPKASPTTGAQKAAQTKSKSKKQSAESHAKPVILAVVIVLALVAIVFAVTRGRGGAEAESISGSNAIKPPVNAQQNGQSGTGAGVNPAGGVGRPPIMGGTAGTVNPVQGNSTNRPTTPTDGRKEYSPSGIGD